MSNFTENIQVISVDYVLNNDEYTKNSIHAIPINDNIQVSVIPMVLITMDEINIERNRKFKFQFLTSLILCSFGITIIIIVIYTNNNNNNKNSHSINPISNNSTI